jgi:hypothetical protein
MPTDFRSFSLSEMLLDWGVAEVTSPRFDGWALAELYRSKIGTNILLNDAEKDELIRTIQHLRAAMLEWVLEHATEWYLADITLEELSHVRADAFWLIKFGARTLGEISLLQPRIQIEGFNFTRIRGRPIIVGPRQTGDLMAIEGAHRCSGILRMQPPEKPSSIKVIIGVCPTIASWPRFSFRGAFE